MKNFTAYAAVLIVLVASATNPCAADAQESQSRQVVIAVLDDYPAFDPNIATREPRARTMRAVVIRSQPAQPQSSAILLNPAHLDANTLAEAFEALTTCPSKSVMTPLPNYVPLFAGAQPRTVQRRSVARAAAWVNELRSRPVEDVKRLAGSGRLITLENVSVCVPNAQ